MRNLQTVLTGCFVELRWTVEFFIGRPASTERRKGYTAGEAGRGASGRSWLVGSENRSSA